MKSKDLPQFNEDGDKDDDVAADGSDTTVLYTVHQLGRLDQYWLLRAPYKGLLVDTCYLAVKRRANIYQSVTVSI